MGREPSLSARAAFVSHRLVGWGYWDPHGLEAYTALGVPNGFGYYVTTRAGLLGKAGPDIVTAAYYSIHPDFIKASYEHLSLVGTVEDAMRIRDDAVLHGLQKYVPTVFQIEHSSEFKRDNFSPLCNDNFLSNIRVPL